MKSVLSKAFQLLKFNKELERRAAKEKEHPKKADTVKNNLPKAESEKRQIFWVNSDLDKLPLQVKGWG